MPKENPIRVLDVRVDTSCTQPSVPRYSMKVIAKADNLTPELLEIAKNNEKAESQIEYIDATHLGTIVEHVNHPSTKESVRIFRRESRQAVER